MGPPGFRFCLCIWHPGYAVSRRQRELERIQSVFCSTLPHSGLLTIDNVDWDVSDEAAGYSTGRDQGIC